MGGTSAITWGLPICQNAESAKADQTPLSIGLRIAAVALGSIAVLTGILVLCNIPGLSQLGTAAGWTILTIGIFSIVLGAALKCIKKNPHNQSINTKNTSEREPKLYQKNEPKDSNLSNGLDQPLKDLNRSETKRETSAKDTPKDRVEAKPPSSENPIELARKEFIEWFSQDGNALGEGQYEAMIAKTKHMANELPKEELTLHYQYFRFGFKFFYAERQGDKKYIPIPWEDGVIMRWQATSEGGSCWPIFDPQKNAYFTPKVTVNTMAPPSGSMPTNQYIYDLLTTARHNQNSNQYRKLEALLPYAKELKQTCGGAMYNEIKKLIPAYP